MHSMYPPKDGGGRARMADRMLGWMGYGYWARRSMFPTRWLGFKFIFTGLPRGHRKNCLSASVFYLYIIFPGSALRFCDVPLPSGLYAGRVYCLLSLRFGQCHSHHLTSSWPILGPSWASIPRLQFPLLASQSPQLRAPQLIYGL